MRAQRRIRIENPVMKDHCVLGQQMLPEHAVILHHRILNSDPPLRSHGDSSTLASSASHSVDASPAHSSQKSGSRGDAFHSTPARATP